MQKSYEIIITEKMADAMVRHIMDVFRGKQTVTL